MYIFIFMYISIRKGPSFVPAPSGINWYEVRRDFDKFVNQLLFLFDSINAKAIK